LKSQNTELAQTVEALKDEITERKQAEKALKRDNKGTGLGLSISKKIVDRHGGNLVIDSELRKGTTARVILPFVQGV